ncbi:MAG: hypothetical protein AB3N09_03630 [Tateyamaria sp.]
MPEFSLSETYRLLAGIISLKQFTSADLAETTGVNPSTAKSWLQRNDGAGRYVFKAGNVKGKRGRGRPPVLWQVREEVIGDIRDEIANLSQMAEVTRGVTSAEEAAAAYADTDYREAVRYHLFQAERADSPEDRQRAIQKARKWFDFELDRLVPWRDQGFDVPDTVRKEIANLHYRLTGLSRQVDALQMIAYGGLLHLADYLHVAIEKWCAASGEDREAFAPLQFDAPSSNVPRVALAEILNTILQTAEQVTKVRQGQVLVALTVVLARVKSRTAYGAICDVLDREGHEKLGRALVTETQELPLSFDTTVLLHQCLTGLRAYPRLLSNDGVGLWVECLPIRDNYDRRLIAAALYCLERRTHVAIATFAEDRAGQIDQMLDDVARDPGDWEAMNRQIGDDVRAFLLKALSNNQRRPRVEDTAEPQGNWADRMVDTVQDFLVFGGKGAVASAGG